jgi:hypothetical protein
MDAYHSIQTEHTERRRHTRTSVGMPVRVHFAGRTVPVTVELRDVSRTGCYFNGATAPKSAKFAFGFVLPDQQVCIAAGQVLRVDRNGFAAIISRTSEAFADYLVNLSGSVATHAA